jgi:hypothetical protein
VKDEPTVPFAVVALLMTGAGGFCIVISRVSVSLPPAFVVVNVTEVFPGVVGVPLITPVLVLIESPAGRGVAL